MTRIGEPVHNGCIVGNSKMRHWTSIHSTLANSMFSSGQNEEVKDAGEIFKYFEQSLFNSLHNLRWRQQIGLNLELNLFQPDNPRESCPVTRNTSPLNAVAMCRC